MKYPMRKVLALAVFFGCAHTAVAENQFALALLAGTADQTTEANNGLNFEGDDNSLGIRASYLFNPYATVELSYLDFGENEESRNPISNVISINKFGVNALQVGVKASWPLSDMFSLHARAGAARWDLSFEERVPMLNRSFSDDDSGTDLYYGLGADLVLRDRWSVSLEHTVLGFDAKIGFAELEQDVKNTSIAIGFRF